MPRSKSSFYSLSPSARLSDGRTLASVAARRFTADLGEFELTRCTAAASSTRRRAVAADGVLRGVGYRTGLQTTLHEERGGVREQRAVSFTPTGLLLRRSIHSGEFRCLDHGRIVRDSVYAASTRLAKRLRTGTAAFLCAHRRRRDPRRTRSPPSAPNSPPPPALPAPSPRRRPYAATPTVWQMACCVVRDAECRYCGGLTVYPRRASSARASWSARSRSSAVCPRRIAAIGADRTGTGTGGALPPERGGRQAVPRVELAQSFFGVEHIFPLRRV